jgi:hypothetical protein
MNFGDKEEQNNYKKNKEKNETKIRVLNVVTDDNT